jgi:hypothetical protein
MTDIEIKDKIRHIIHSYQLDFETAVDMAVEEIFDLIKIIKK